MSTPQLDSPAAATGPSPHQSPAPDHRPDAAPDVIDSARPAVLFELRIDQEGVSTPNPNLTGSELLALAKKSSEDWCLVRIGRDREEELIAPSTRLDLLGSHRDVLETRPAIPLAIEGTTFRWFKTTIKAEEIANLGGWPAASGVVEVDNDQSERTLAPGEVVTLHPDREFGKRHRWKRGRR